MEGMKAASATLSRATGFFGAGYGLDGPHRAKVIGNGLRELDRFLNLLLDEVAAVLGLPNRSVFVRQRNTANKLRAIERAMACPSGDAERLRAIGRARDALFHCAGIVRRADDRGGDRMTMGWRAPCVAVGDPIAVGAIELASICRFYDRIARRLIAACEDYGAGATAITASASVRMPVGIALS
ncbi:MAG: hypothetical protein JWO65_1648 [Sphingomonas bacterium]|nr:hypothetical protein [Sphingomonas bacterium]